MNQLLLKHCGSNLFSIPDGLKELMSDITREDSHHETSDERDRVLREQPPRIFEFVSNYLSVLLITRENTMISVTLLEDLCDCRPMLKDHLVEIGVSKNDLDMIADRIKNNVEMEEPVIGEEKMQELFLMRRVVEKLDYSASVTAKICQITQCAYRDYWYRKQTLEKSIIVDVDTDHPWKVAAQNTLDIYKSTKPSATELRRAEEKIEAAYKNYHTQRKLLKHLLSRPKEPSGSEVTKLDVITRRVDKKVDVELGSLKCIKSRDNVVEERQKTRITHILNDEEDDSEPKLDMAKKPKKTFKFSSDSKDSVAYFTEVKVTPKIGTTNQSIGTSTTMSQTRPVADVAKDVMGGLEEPLEDIPELINTTDVLSDVDDDVPEAISDTASGASSFLTMAALDPLSSDTEEVEDDTK